MGTHKRKSAERVGRRKRKGPNNERLLETLPQPGLQSRGRTMGPFKHPHMLGPPQPRRRLSPNNNNRNPDQLGHRVGTGIWQPL